jgi:hypothetical protein
MVPITRSRSDAERGVAAGPPSPSDLSRRRCTSPGVLRVVPGREPGLLFSVAARDL